MKLQFKIENEHIKLMSLSDYPVSDSINYLTASFEFDSEWDGFAKTALFSNGNGSRCVLLENDECVIPWETLTGRFLYISAYGVKDNVRITATEIKIPIAPSGYCEGETPQPPTPTVYEQILQKLSEVTQNGGSGEITDGSITSEKLADGAVTYNKLDDYTKSEISAAGSQAYEKAEEAMVAASGVLAECSQLRHQVITNSSLISSEQTAREEADAALESSLAWTLIGETELTQDDIDAAGEAGITALTIGNSANFILDGYRDVLVVVYAPIYDVNTETRSVRLGFGATKANALTVGQYEFIRVHSINHAPLYFDKKNRIKILINFDENGKQNFSQCYFNTNAIPGYATTVYGTATSVDCPTTSKGKYLSVNSGIYQKPFYFGAGSYMKVYGRGKI